jgi:hypothetical protein
VLSGCRARSRADHTATQPVDSNTAPRPAPVPLAPRPQPSIRPADAGARALRLDPPIEIGRAAPLAGVSDGALIRTQSDDVALLAFERPKGQSATESIDAGNVSMMPAPAIARESRAYWISDGRLVRRTFARSASGPTNTGQLEVLAKDAYDGTRVAVRTLDTPVPRDLVAYITRPTTPRGDRRARLWVENATDQDAAGESGRSFDLSDEGAGGSSVALAGSDTRTWAVSLDARIAMSPVHARAIDLAGDSTTISPDVVVFVGEAEAAHTEIDVAISGGEPVALVPLPKDAGGFGLALIAFGREPRLDSPAVWTMYPNGIKPALTAVGSVCATEWVAYVRPTEATPGAPKVLVMAPIDGLALGAEITVVEAMRFTSLAFAPSAGGAGAKRKAGWLTWSADGRSWACALRCR